MSVRYLNCVAGDALAEHQLYRLTFVPANWAIAPLLSHWSTAAHGVFDALAGTMAYPAQGQPVIVDTAAGKAAVFDVKLRWPLASGNTVQGLAAAASDAYPTTTVAQVERITAVIGPGLAARAVAESATATTVAADVAAANPLTTGLAALGTAGKWAIAGVIALVVLVLVVKLPRVAA